MNDQLDELTRELANMRPAQPSQRLTDRIGQELYGHGRSLMRDASAGGLPGAWLRWLPLAAAAILMLAVATVAIVTKRYHHAATRSDEGIDRAAVTMAEGSSAASAEPTLHLVRNANYLIDAEDNGLIDVPTPVPLRKVTWQFVSASEFRDQRDNAMVKVFVPRQETVLIPVAIH